ncbi:hypothetical protein A3H26_02845 [candidate division WWE3 bacterium RIFCSPLOWO2_12_FULL_36_10]|uniref:N-acetyltransferase domain-containing protein n=1 Tax=candidate division WWE3 bacterium RIFCSPLOWO2_12_FULL_36_10 TaxID=1802630 RepID=A0A1F4VK51_UNCKA|nr:MAG: hypothetical protein A3H26_02845 [candidate division WWE3 bacterium RIFCSPLOWO2_12_FULL_36_10]
MFDKVNLKIKKALTTDIPVIVNIHKECVSNTNSTDYTVDSIKEWLHQISEKNVLDQFETTLWYLIKTRNDIIGFCQYSIENKELYQIQISPVYQQKGYGKILYKFIESDFRKNKIEKIKLNATLNAVGFYRKLGFNEIKHINFMLHKESLEMIEMEKDLSKNY